MQKVPRSRIDNKIRLCYIERNETVSDVIMSTSEDET